MHARFNAFLHNIAIQKAFAHFILRMYNGFHPYQFKFDKLYLTVTSYGHLKTRMKHKCPAEFSMLLKLERKLSSNKISKEVRSQCVGDDF